MNKIVIPHNTNIELEVAIGNSLQEKLGDDFLDHMVVKLEDGAEVIYSLLDSDATNTMIQIWASYGIEVLSVEDWEEDVYDLYFKNQLTTFLDEFEDYDTTGFVTNFYTLVNSDSVLDKISTSGIQTLTQMDQEILFSA